MATGMGTFLKANDVEHDKIRAAQGGDLEAFNELVLSYQDSVYRWVYRLVGDPSLAEDLSQVVFITAYQKLNSFRYGSFRSWLFRIAQNESYDELRRRKRHASISLEQTLWDDQDRELIDTLDGNEPAPEEVVEVHEREQFIHRLLQKLPVEHCKVLMLVDMEAMDYQEAAQTLGVPIGTIKSRLARARGRFRQLLMENGFSGFNQELALDFQRI
jgi:RNA polymerase sigma-70 factor (ECF subfamily)